MLSRWDISNEVSSLTIIAFCKPKMTSRAWWERVPWLTSRENHSCKPLDMHSVGWLGCFGINVALIQSYRNYEADNTQSLTSKWLETGSNPGPLILDAKNIATLQPLSMYASCSRKSFVMVIPSNQHYKKSCQNEVREQLDLLKSSTPDILKTVMYRNKTSVKSRLKIKTKVRVTKQGPRAIIL